ncbi:MAG: hypothetical protein CVT74_02025 [Alphaproteobacteria bacterium HGW-Alphaproteobacteria-13]|jgi:hypothetical protein|nr:MAG: hypothetical protein CVT74_02025 [Alphaproteobacteria bacterium HGW-Alphaproteobacteria-13]
MPRFINRTAKIASLAVAAMLLTGAQSRLGDLDSRLLASHNRERAIAGVPPLRWNANLARSAQTWADHLVRTGRFEHSPNIPGHPPEGENIWGGTPGAFRPEAMVDRWIAEKEYFIPGVFPANSRTGRPEDVSHYTQIVWGRSAEVGCGLARRDDEEILVCRYSEPGNVMGRDPFAQDWRKRLAALEGDYSTLKAPLAMSAAGFAAASSALIEGRAALDSDAPGSPGASEPVSLSAAMGDEGRELAAMGG